MTINYVDWTGENLSLAGLELHQKEVALWHTSLQDDRPTVLLIHGITGDHFGLVPLVERLAVDYNCIIAELPGHGGSQPLVFDDACALQEWFDDLYTVIEASIIDIDIICAHSFGCIAVVGGHARTAKTVLLNPVPWPSSMYSQYARLIMRFAGFWAAFYNMRAFIFLRSMTLAKIKTYDARRRIGYVAKYSRPTYKQVVYQAKLVDIILDNKAYIHVKDSVDLIVCGSDDTTAQQRDSGELQAIFGSSPIVFLSGGHLLPIESPQRIAQLVREIV